MHKIKTVGFWRFFLLAVLALSLLPVFGIAFYNHSSADDYSYGCMARYAWVDTRNIFNVLMAAAEKVKETYFEWQGSYAAVALFALQPAVFGEQFYPLASFLIMGLFLFAVFYFFRRIIKEVFKGDVRIADIIAAVSALLSIQLLPAPVEGFFWWNGSSYYVFFYSLALIQAANLSVSAWSRRCGKGRFVSLLVLAAAIGGGNYISALVMAEITVILFAWGTFRQKKISPRLTCVVFATIGCFLVNCLAPGNAVRQGAFESWSPVRAVLYSYHEAYNHMVEWTSPLLAAGLVFLVPFLWRIPVQNYKKSFWFFALLLGVEFSVFASSFTPTLYAYGSVGAGRIQNIRYFLWVMTCLGALFTVICCIKSMAYYCGEEGGRLAGLVKRMYEEYAVPFFAVVVFSAAFFAGNSILADDVRDMTSISAAKSLLSGEAAQYGREAKKRQEILLGEEKRVELQPYSCKPELLFWEDIKEDPEDWVNSAVARFYRKEEVRLR